MQIIVRAKQAGRKHALIENKTIEIDDLGSAPRFADLLKAVVKQQVEEYNRKPVEKNLLPFLSKDEVNAAAETGKVGFGSLYNENKADVAKAQAVALEAFEDGMFAVFAGDDELGNLDEPVQLNATTVITFIRLTFLAGSYW